MDTPSEVVDAAFVNEPESVWIAQMWCHGAIAEWAPHEVLERVELILNELMANAVLHGGGQVEVHLVRQTGEIEISVADGANGFRAASSDKRGDGAGSGLSIVEALAVAWGVQSLEGSKGKRVWARVAISNRAEP